MAPSLVHRPCSAGAPGGVAGSGNGHHVGLAVGAFRMGVSGRFAAGASCSARAAAWVLPVPWKWVAGPF